MARRTVISHASEVKDDDLDIGSGLPYTSVEQSELVVCKFPATVRMVGAVSGKHYKWDGAGTKVQVDVRDIDDLLTKHVGETACCGNRKIENFLFERG